MKLIYIGSFESGTTSRQRAETLSTLDQIESVTTIDTSIPWYKEKPIFRSLAFRFMLGPYINRINRFISSEIKDQTADIIWVDKAIFITPATTQKLKKVGKILIHYTPDVSFYHNSSKKFFNSLDYYDFLVTTKSFELDRYKSLVDPDKVILTTQAFDKKMHRMIKDIHDRKFGVVFIGKYERSRGEILQALIGSKIFVAYGGAGWREKFKPPSSNYEFLGDRIMEDDYVRQLNEYTFALGAISHLFPEKHTTRTFEIPACGTILLTEKNEETQSYFTDEEAVFFDSPIQLVEKLVELKDKPLELKLIAENGHNRVMSDGRDYQSILEKIISKIK